MQTQTENSKLYCRQPTAAIVVIFIDKYVFVLDDFKFHVYCTMFRVLFTVQ